MVVIFWAPQPHKVAHKLKQRSKNCRSIHCASLSCVLTAVQNALVAVWDERKAYAGDCGGPLLFMLLLHC